MEDGLEQEFNSLDAQREAGEAYVTSQKMNDWRLVPTHNDDGGFSGGNNNMFIAVFCNKTPSLSFIFLLPSWFHRIAVPPLLIYCSRVNITALYLSI